jgi:hypothetical protein
MDLKVYKLIDLTLNEHDTWMLESILQEFVKGRKGAETEGDSFDKFASKLAKKLKNEVIEPN